MEWIKVTDRLPAWGEEVFAFGIDLGSWYFTTHQVFIVEFYPSQTITRTDTWIAYADSDNQFILNDVTHWMPLQYPEPPKD